MSAFSNNPQLDDLSEADIFTVQKALSRGEISCLELVDLFIRRIEQVDKTGPTLEAVIEMNPDARDIAREMDQERNRSGSRKRKGVSANESALAADKPLFGIPILLKANIDTGDKMITDAGSLALAGHRPTEDAPLVKRLRAAGAIILGKSNLSEWANFRSTRSVSGWSSRGGQTRNPYVLDRNPCGSSSGSAVAVSAGLCIGAVGTETDGSVICPSSSNGIVGIKPTVGRISSRGIIPISKSQDTAGPMARSVQDAARMLEVMAETPLYRKRNPLSGGRYNQAHSPESASGPGSAGNLDSASGRSRTGGPGSSGSFGPADLRGLRIGIVENLLGKDGDVDGIFDEVLRILRGAGTELIPAPLVDPERYEEAEMEVLLYEFKAGVNDYLASCTASTGVRSLEDLIAYNNEHRDRIMPHFGQELLLEAASRGNLDAPIYLKARKHAQSLTREKGIDGVMNRLNLQALIAPSGGPAWKTDWINGDHFRIGSSSYAAVSGYPSITVPAGFIRGLPVGISFFGYRWSEGDLISIAGGFEEISHCRRAPEYLPSIEVASF